MNEEEISLVPEEVIMSKIYIIQDKKVILDFDLAPLYGVETKQLKRAVRRNINRFPKDFMFELNSDDLSNWRNQFGTSNREKMGLRIKPFAFTEHGVLMLASVLNSERAVHVNIQIVRIFTKMREMLHNYQDIIQKIDQLDTRLSGHDEKIFLIFEYIRQLEMAKQEEKDFSERRRIGFRQDEQQ